MSAHQCPRCELRFSFRTEVEWHLASDHRPVERATDAGTNGDTRAESPADAELVTTPAPVQR